MRNESMLAGLGFGLIFGLMQGFTNGPVMGLYCAVLGGVGFGLAIYWFTNHPAIKRQYSLAPNDLLPGERVLMSKPANLIIRPKDFGLGKFAFDDLLWAVGMKDKEALGGALHVTNLRLVFKTHRINRLRGKTSICLPLITDLSNDTWLMFRRLTLTTATAKVELVMSDIDRVIGEIRSAQETFSSASLDHLKQYLLADPGRFTDGLESWTGLNTTNNLINLAKHTGKATTLVTNPLGALGSIFMKELFDRTVAEEWQQVVTPKIRRVKPTPPPSKAA